MDDPVAIWSLVEDDALERNEVRYHERVVPDHPTIHAVVFIESDDGVRRIRPVETTTDLPGPEAGSASALDHPPVTEGNLACGSQPQSHRVPAAFDAG